MVIAGFVAAALDVTAALVPVARHAAGELSTAEHSLGVLTSVAVVGPIWYGAAVWRRLLLPGWQWPLARLAEVVAVSATLLLLAQLLGAVGLFSAVPLVITAAASGGVAVLAARRQEPRGGLSALPPAPESSGPMTALALGATVAVVSVYGLEVLSVLRGNGIMEFDSLSYHLPVAADFVQDRSLLGLTIVANPPVSFYPFNGELVHAIGMVLLGHDALSPTMNLAWLSVALLAGWSVGVPFGRAPLALIAVATIAVTPLLIYSEAGTANVDLMGLAFALAAAALVVNAGEALWPILLASISIGLIVGTKLPMTPTAAALVVAAIAALPRADRLKWGRWALLCVFLAGSFWYIRNTFHVGNPVPWVGLNLGVLNLPSLGLDPTDCTLTPVAHWLGNPSILADSIAPQLRTWLGLLWPVLLVISVLGAALAIALDRRPAVRMVGAVALVGWAAYLVTPASGGEHHANVGDPTCFGYNLRFAIAPIALGMVAALLVLPRKMTGIASVGMTALLVVTMLSTDRPRWLIPVGLAAAAGLAVLGGWRYGRSTGALGPTRRSLTYGMLALGLVVMAVVGLPVVNRYLDGRYSETAGRGTPAGEAAPWARDVEDARIGVGGYALTYPLYGLRVTNAVSYVTQPDSPDPFSRPGTCDEWREVLTDGKFDYIVTAPYDPQEPPPDEAAWTRADARASEILSIGPLSVFAFDADSQPEPCQ